MIKAILSLFASAAPAAHALPAPAAQHATPVRVAIIADHAHNPLACGLDEMRALLRRGHSEEYALACAMKRAFAEHYHAAPNNAGRKVFAALDELLARAIDDERGAA